ncbi:DUF4864 domain-containing protein [Oceanicella sp. SM1341]|uniref:DUF4864 domain-containing protein n=1 Tax=Oceanicella sp. SM1341 TaxID=1548889 RepID=UPI000E483254|nr:DUF4864 domain-containing protein [Oceanicella sp. SM1341]
MRRHGFPAALRAGPKAAALAVLLAFAVPAPAPAGEREDQIAAVITRQIEAFRAEDLDGAFALASPMIRQMFHDARNFGAMVRNGYPMVWRPEEVTMGPVVMRDGKPVQTVFLRDARGLSHIAEYTMVETDAGWRIDGVRIIEGTGSSV